MHHMKTRPSHYLFATAIATAAIGCTTESEPTVTDDPEELAVCLAPNIDIDRSLFVSPTVPVEQNELRARFSVSRIMQHILQSARTARPTDGTELWRRWWDTQNGANNSQFTDNPH